MKYEIEAIPIRILRPDFFSLGVSETHKLLSRETKWQRAAMLPAGKISPAQTGLPNSQLGKMQLQHDFYCRFG
jgi:hypothetical protein